MSEIMTSQKMKRICDACGASKEWELVGVQESSILEMQEWYVVQRKVVIDGHFTKIEAHACSLACVPAAAVKLALPSVEDEPTDDIDLASLRANGVSN